MVDLRNIQEAKRRVAAHVRRTPLVAATALRQGGRGALTLKMESLQVTGSFKARGATNKVLGLPAEQVARGLVTASGGNHGLGVAYAGWLSKAPVTIYLPSNVPPAK